MDIALFENAKFGDIFITTEKKQAVFLRLAENAEYKFAFLYVKDWGTVQVFRHNGKEIHNDVAHSVVGKQEELVSEDLDEAADNCYYRHHSCARKSFIEGASWQKEKDDKLFTLAYMDGVEKGKQQMMKDSISATIESDLDPLWAFYGKQKIVCEWGELEAKKFKEGTKVKLIIIKED